MALLHIIPTNVEGCKIVDTTLYEDMRGNFVETWNQRDFLAAGLPIDWPQDNVSKSRAGVLRGMHIQLKNPQGKLVRCVSGAVYDVCLDLRKESPTFLEYHAELLKDGRSMYCPPGTAHGFLALENDSVVYYKCTTLYDSASDSSIHPLDLELNIPWLALVKDPIMSPKDKQGLPVREWMNLKG